MVLVFRSPCMSMLASWAIESTWSWLFSSASPRSSLSSFYDWTVDVLLSEGLTVECLLLKTIRFDWDSIPQSSFFKSVIYSMWQTCCFFKAWFFSFSRISFLLNSWIAWSWFWSLDWASDAINFFYFAFLAWSTTLVVCFSKWDLSWVMVWLALFSSLKSFLLFKVSFSSLTESCYFCVFSCTMTPSSLRLTLFYSWRASCAIV